MKTEEQNDLVAEFTAWLGSNSGVASKKSCTQVRDFYFLPLTSSLLPKMAGFFGK